MLKGIRGLVAALVLGMGAAVCNFAYLNTSRQGLASVQFVGIKPGVTVKKGEPLSLERLTVVSIPRNSVGNLASFAVPQTAQASVIGHHATRMLAGGSLVYNDDIKTPPPELAFGQTAGPNETSRERAMCIPFDTHALIPSLINPGDEVSVLIPKATVPRQKPLAPTPANAEDAGAGAQAADAATAGEGTELLGPFKILSVGNRLGSIDVMLAAGQRPAQEDILTISVMVDAQGNLEPKAQRLWEMVRASNYQGVGLLLHPRPRK